MEAYRRELVASRQKEIIIIFYNDWILQRTIIFSNNSSDNNRTRMVLMIFHALPWTRKFNFNYNTCTNIVNIFVRK